MVKIKNQACNATQGSRAGILSSSSCHTDTATVHLVLDVTRDKMTWKCSACPCSSTLKSLLKRQKHADLQYDVPRPPSCSGPLTLTPCSFIVGPEYRRKEWAEWRLSLLYKSGFMSWHSVVCALGLPQPQNNSKNSLLARLSLAQSSSFSSSLSVGSQILSRSQSVSQRFIITAFLFWKIYRMYTFYRLL